MWSNNIFSKITKIIVTLDGTNVFLHNMRSELYRGGILDL